MYYYRKDSERICLYKSSCREGFEDTQKYIIITQSSGKFFEVYGYDAFMFGYLFDYKVLQNGKTYKCGFPDSSITKITNKLSDLKISYQIIYRGKIHLLKVLKKLINILNIS